MMIRKELQKLPTAVINSHGTLSHSMNLRIKRFLKYVCPPAALCLVVMQVCSVLITRVADPQRARGITGTDKTSCQALFTITDVPRRHAANASLFIRDLQGHLATDKLRVDWRARQYNANLGAWDAATAVQQVLLRRDSPSGASTTDYSPLATLLPSVLAFQGEGEGSAPSVTTNSRIGAAGGLLPYVPCEIATYGDPASVTACFRARLAQEDSFWVCFMGDSKIRNLFYEFLYRNEELQYLIKFPNGRMPFAALDREHVKFKLDMEASSTMLPGLNISFQFRTFSLGGERSSAGVQQLRRWAEGQETPPHLLVLGYASWTIMMAMAVHLQDALDSLMHMHAVVVPLLHQMSHKTRVVFMPQSRYKVHGAEGKRSTRRGLLGDPVYDWSEAVLLHHLRRHSRYRPSPPPSGTPDTLPEPAARLTRLDRQGSRLRDHMVPEEENDGVWWWDTSLPLSLAENSECEELYLRGMNHHPIYNSSFHRCYDANHAGTVTLGDQVTMLLNLVCNSVLGGREGLCCG